jgi:lipid-A-disaccharide synthase-like uncharacterized protein
MPASSSFLQRWLEPLLGGWLYADSTLWTVVGFLGAAIFGSRFVLQWLKSEKEKKLVVPWYFWHLSFWGSVLNLLYFLHLDKAPLILGNCFLPFLYGRNILFLRAGGEKGRGRLVFAAVAALTVVGFVISAFIGKPANVHANRAVLTAMQNIRAALLDHGSEKPIPGDSREIMRSIVAKHIKAGPFAENGDWLDPWGNPYKIFVSGKTCLIRCAGPNGVYDDIGAEKRDDLLLEFAIGGP